MTGAQRSTAAGGSPAAGRPATGSPSPDATDPWWRTDVYDYVLPPELIAQHPAPERGGSRLLHVRQDGLADLAFRQLPQLVAPGDVMVFNDTRVLKSRLFGRKPSGGRVELLLERVLGPATARFQLRASHPPHIGGRIDLPGDVSATVLARDGRFVDLQFTGAASVIDYLGRFGSTPLPPYIARPADADDDARYQTVYARRPGAVAAPTAGLHFDPESLAALDARGVTRVFVTLHVGSGTFAPVGTEDLRTHRMHSEWFDIPADTATAIAAARARGSRVMAVGTTSLRALEAAGRADGTVPAGAAETSIFIHPGYRFRVVDRLLTNFHLPRSTLLMLVSAFAGLDTMRAAYAHAIAARYRFFSYGDASLLERADVPADVAGPAA